MFQPKYLGATGEAMQEVAPGVAKGIREGSEAVRGRVADLALQAEKLGMTGPDVAQQMRAILEGHLDPVAFAQQRGLDPATFTGFVDKTRQLVNDAHADAVYWGRPPNTLEDLMSEYFPRQMRFEETAKGRAGAGKYRVLETQDVMLGEREKIFKNIPEGTGVQRIVDPETGQVTQQGRGLEGMRTDPNVVGDNVTPPTAADHIRTNYLNMTPQELNDLSALKAAKPKIDLELTQLEALKKSGSLTPAMAQRMLDLKTQLAEMGALEGRFNQGEALADFFRSTVKDQGMLGFTYHPIDDASHYVMRNMKTTEAAKGIYGLIDTAAVDAAEAGPGAVRIEKLLDDVGLTHSTRLDRLRDLGIDAQALAGGKLIPADVYKDAVRYFQGFTRPETLTPIMEAVDYATRLFKGAVTSWWPSYHVRNFVSNTWMNALEGALSKKSIMMAHSLLNGEVVEGASKLKPFIGMNLTDEAATDMIRKLSYQYRIAGEHTAVSAAELADTTHEILGKMPGKVVNKWGDVLPTAGQAIPPPIRKVLGMEELPGIGAAGGPGVAAGPATWWEHPANPLNPQTFGLNVAGRKLGTRIEETSRLSGFIELMDQGMAPEVAGARIRAAQVDYGDLTQFEKTVMRRLIPFYTYARKSIPYQIDQLMQRPGGLLGTAVKAAGEARGAYPGFLPDYLKNTVALPVGEATTQEGVPTQRYLSQIGLPFEDLAQNLSMRGLLGGLNPYIKTPLEMATGQQFFSGRKLSDLYSPSRSLVDLGPGNIALDQLLYNSPVARIASTATNVADPRKGLADMLLHTLTGFRLSDVDMAKAQNVAIRDWLDQQLTGPQFRRFQSIYVRPEDRASLAPGDMELYRLYVARERAAQALARQQRP
jgi:hypothetical protein